MLDSIKNIFIIGIKGVAMANLAVIFKKMGKNVTGSDVGEEFITDELLEKNNIHYSIGFSSTNLPKNSDLIVYSAAHEGINNPQVIEAKKRNIKIVSQAQILGELTNQFQTTIAVCGCHGKTTTASLLTYCLIQLGQKPSYLVGTSKFGHFWGGDYQSKKYFVIEADEYGVNPPFDKTPKFHFLNPDYTICTNIDFDHPDVYKDIYDVKRSFLKFFKQTKKKLFLCADNRPLMEVANKLPKEKYLTFGYDRNADLIIDKNDFFISFAGEKNLSNAAGVALCLMNLGYTRWKIKDAMKDFPGAKRRFEKIFHNKKNNIYLFDDYAHHPKEIEATIQTAREKFPKRRIIVIFQPHTYSRTQALIKDFTSSLSLADYSLILPIFPSAREKINNFSISSEDIVKLNPKRLVNFSSRNQLLKYLAAVFQSQDIIFTMGAGDVYKLKDDIIRIISNGKT